MSTQAAATSVRYPVQWIGRHAILALSQYVGESNAAQIRAPAQELKPGARPAALGGEGMSHVGGNGTGAG